MPQKRCTKNRFSPPPRSGKRARGLRTAAALVALITSAGIAAPALAQSDADLARELERLRSEVSAQRDRLRQQEQRLNELEHALKSRSAQEDRALEQIRGAGEPGASSVAQSTTQPVGQAPTPEKRPEVQALSNVGGVLTPKGFLTLEPSLEYDNTQTNRFFFAGTEITNAVFIGGLEAVNARRNTLTGALAARYGLTDRIELTARIPYVYRSDRESTGTNTDTLSRNVEGNDIGDVEFGVNYQLPTNIGNAYYVANLRVKSNTGDGQFDVPYDATGQQLRLPTGSGFWGVEPSLTAIKAVDPVVLFGNIGYTINIGEDVNKTVPGVGTFGNVDPGDVLRGTFGMGFAINDKISLSLGYEHDWVMSTTSTVNGVETDSEELQIGSFLAGVSYQLLPRTTANFNVYVGATRDAPDVRLLFSLPITLDLFGGE